MALPKYQPVAVAAKRRKKSNVYRDQPAWIQAGRDKKLVAPLDRWSTGKGKGRNRRYYQQPR